MTTLLNFLAALVGWFCPAVVWQIPPGLTPDNSAQWGMFQGLVLLNDYCYVPVTLASAVAMTLTAAQLSQLGMINITGAQGGAITATTDTAAAILAAMSPNFIGLPLNSTYASPVRIMNNGTGQVITVVGGTGVTISGTATIASGSWREFMMIPTAAGAITMLNVGGGTI